VFIGAGGDALELLQKSEIPEGHGYVNGKERLNPAVTALHDAIAAKSRAWRDIVKVGRTHTRDATPLTLGQEWSGYAGMLSDDLERIEGALQGVYRLALGGTAVGTASIRPPALPKLQRFKSPSSLAYSLSRQPISSPCRALTMR
jgi:adenylosuccinate lyase